MTDLPAETVELLGEPYITPEEVLAIAGANEWEIRERPPIPKLRVGGKPRFRRADAELWRDWLVYKATLIRRSEAADRLGVDRQAFYALLGHRVRDFYAQTDTYWGVVLPSVPVLDADMIEPDRLAEWEAIATLVRDQAERDRVRAERAALRAARAGGRA